MKKKQRPQEQPKSVYRILTDTEAREITSYISPDQEAKSLPSPELPNVTEFDQSEANQAEINSGSAFEEAN